MHVITLMNQEFTNLKESKEGYLGEFKGRKIRKKYSIIISTYNNAEFRYYS